MRLADIGRCHRRQRQADIVNSNSHAHSRLELCEQWIATERVIQCVTNGSLTIRQALDRWIGIENARSDRDVFQDEVFTGRHNARRAIAIDVDY